MKTINQLTVDIMNYIVAFSENEVTDEIRNKLINNIDDFATYREIFNNMISSLKMNIINNKIVPENACEFLEAEYQALDFDKFINFNYLRDLIFISLTRLIINSYTFEDTWGSIYSVLDKIKTLDDDQLKSELYYVCVIIIHTYELIEYDIKTTEDILDYCKDIDFDTFMIELLPISLVAF